RISIILCTIIINLYAQRTYTLTAPDTIIIGQNYKCEIDLNPISYKGCSMDLYFFDLKLPKLSPHKFLFEYSPILPENPYELNVIITDCGKKDTAYIIKNIFYIDFDKKKATKYCK